MNEVKTTCYDNGNKESENTYVNGKLNICISWYTNGNKYSECVHVDGSKNAEYDYVNGKMNGIGIIYYKNGNKNSECVYVKDIMHGACIFWNEDGSTFTKRVYENGKIIEQKR